MGHFTLPSGRVLETKDPTFGDVIRITGLGLDRGTEAFTLAKFRCVVPELSEDEIGALDRMTDGPALLKEVNRIYQGRPAEKEDPLGRASSDSSKGSASIRSRKRSNGSANIAGVNV